VNSNAKVLRETSPSIYAHSCGSLPTAARYSSGTIRHLTLRNGLVLLAIVSIFLTGCRWTLRSAGPAAPAVEFISVPLAQAGDPNNLSAIRGRVVGAHSNQQIVLYARSQATWWVQPFANQPFTRIQTDSTWRNATHPGIEYAALLVGPDFRPVVTTDVLPTAGVIASAVTKGTPPVWQRWWFVLTCVLAGLLGVFAIHRLRINQMANKLNIRFEERLAERMRVAQILHDTLLQGVISASMQLHVAVDQLPASSPALAPLQHVLQSMGQVVEEGRNTLRGLRSPTESVRDLEDYLSRIPQELKIQEDVGFRVTVKGPALPLQPRIRVDLYGIGREAVVNALRRSRATHVEVELRYTASEFRLLVRDNGSRLLAGHNGPSGSSGMRERAERIGARLKIRNRIAGGTEIELRVPGNLAFESHFLDHASGWLRGVYRRRVQWAKSD